AALELDGVILTKLDGDARGGAALSVRKVTGVPVKFVGKGEKLDKLEAFEPERLVGQMLGMGDIIDLVRTAQEAVDEDEARRQQERLSKGKFDLNDFRQQIVQMKKMGSVGELMSKIPGLNQMSSDLGGIDADSEIQRIQGIIDSMTQLDKIRALTGLGRAAANNPGARLFAPKVGTGKRLSPKERDKLRKQREKDERRRRREERDRPTT